MPKIKENCGVVGIYSLSGKNVIPMVFDALRALQHRGQEAWGFAVPNKPPFKKIGLVSHSSSEFKKIAQEYASPCVIGHVRYSTMGTSNLENAQPLKVKDLCIAHNGTIANAQELSNLVGGCSFTPQSASDTLVAAQRLVTLISENGEMGKALSILKNEMVGSYCFTFISDDNSVYGARDPKGFRPMVLGYKESDDTYIVTSESSAITAVGATLQRDVIPGELIKLSKNGLETEKFSDDTSRAHCSFEFTYFAHPSSMMEGHNIYISRKNIGRFMAKKFPITDADLVIPVPDSARPAALGYAQELGIPFDEGLLKDRYSKKGPLRSFIEPHQSDRVEINRWIIPISEIMRDKHVIVIDDSLVRGTSSKAIIKAIRRAGAKKISMLITYPQINYPCYAGIDFPSQEELATYTDGKEMTSEEITEMVRKSIDVDFLGYNDAENLANAVGMPKSSMCFTCSSGNYDSLGIKPDFTKREQVKAKI
ncbi:MAG: amidophosphoribosyltransferase [Candidatus Nitrosopumilus limneticus]|nr:Amidophosphoribosyltransferase [Candidatus Nitrosopumilus limneticus]MDC4212414.1 amidophosphoribosyltransferase [Candidatus Nitrosopumilus limneticus]MDC4215695.1 amidophosphoribosyltransferase [Candidatus Nitrosopumilus limneticus]MDC4217167.1 amidophosphoribosyltransferase [Candidatus Nitrosopumilus limneticus]MDC4217956.1 amidophosphoribosyltransferase [Candidatus Nitrosopumilus limneticus]